MSVADRPHRFEVRRIAFAKEFLNLINKSGRYHCINPLVDAVIQQLPVHVKADFQHPEGLILKPVFVMICRDRFAG